MELIRELLNSKTREGALQELSKKREMYDDLALVLWHSFGKSYMRSFVLLYKRGGVRFEAKTGEESCTPDN